MITFFGVLNLVIFYIDPSIMFRILLIMGPSYPTTNLTFRSNKVSTYSGGNSLVPEYV